MRWTALFTLALLASACGSAASQAVPTAAASAVITPTLTPTPSPTTVITATPSPTTSPTPVPPSPTPAPALVLRIGAELDPPTPHAGEEFVIALSISNDGGRSAHGIHVETSGPWDRWSILDIQPSGTFARDAAGWHIVSGIDVPPRETRTLEVHVRADEASEEQLTFAIREADPGELP